MRLPRNNWFAIVRRKFRRSPPCHESVTILRNNASGGSFSQASSAAASYSQFLSKEDMAAITIQAHFRSHLARRAFRALRSLVKLQAVARGVCVRRQARIALHCMHALARLQVTVRARQLLTSCELKKAHES
ncbi:PREDICTED: protein IQ-DOMAIN 31 [Ipomoea nil]|uniref:protein IQ-DOMAIN 31 n=1 Tax=Ipomoea nil TaxID=35883 RepID=UPI0009018E80|nr:PREDICTED: protein IQ-DOMAIN 31 [Ipomoea nil]